MATRNRLALRSVVALSTIILVAVTFAPSVRAEVAAWAPLLVPRQTLRRRQWRSWASAPVASVNGFMSNRTPAERIWLGYPPKVRPDWPAHSAGFAGLIRMQVTSGPANGTNFLAYCIDLLTDTNVGVGYRPGEWTEANVPNVGYVAQLLQSYSRQRTNLTRGPRRRRCNPRSGTSATASSCRRTHRLYQARQARSSPTSLREDRSPHHLRPPSRSPGHRPA